MASLAVTQLVWLMDISVTATLRALAKERIHYICAYMYWYMYITCVETCISVYENLISLLNLQTHVILCKSDYICISIRQSDNHF